MKLEQNILLPKPPAQPSKPEVPLAIDRLTGKPIGQETAGKVGTTVAAENPVKEQRTKEITALGYPITPDT